MSEGADCDGLIVYNEVFISNIPALIFMIAGPIDFFHIRSIGFNRVVKYSVHFKFKLYTVSIICLSEVIRVILFNVQHVWWEKHFNGNNEQCDHHLTFEVYYTLLSIVTAVAWVGSFNLMIYQYRKGLSETWYSLKMFWILNALVQTYVFIYGLATKQYSETETALGTFDFVFAIILILLLFFTTTRTVDRPRGNNLDRSSKYMSQDSELRQSKHGGMYGSIFGEQLSNEGDPKIKVTIKPRAKDKPTDDFRLNISYEFCIPPKENELAVSPVGGKPDIEFTLEDIEEEGLIQQTLQDYSGEPVIKNITLAKSFDQILFLENLVQRQFNKHRDVLKFVQFMVLTRHSKTREQDWDTKFTSFKATCPQIDHETKYVIQNQRSSKSE